MTEERARHHLNLLITFTLLSAPIQWALDYLTKGLMP